MSAASLPSTASRSCAHPRNGDADQLADHDFRSGEIHTFGGELPLHRLRILRVSEATDSTRSACSLLLHQDGTYQQSLERAPTTASGSWAARSEAREPPPQNKERRPAARQHYGRPCAAPINRWAARRPPGVTPRAKEGSWRMGGAGRMGEVGRMVGAGARLDAELGGDDVDIIYIFIY